MDNPPPGFDPDYHAMMQRQAPEEFPAFFAEANPAEASIMDAAYVGAKAYREAVQTPRPAPMSQSQWSPGPPHSSPRESSTVACGARHK